MTELLVAIVFTLGVSAICSLLEAMILSTTTAEIEDLKRKSLKRGMMLELFKKDMEETSSAILSLNTIANTLGATFAGGIFKELHTQGALPSIFSSHNSLLYFSLGLTIGILIFSEIIPKNIGVIYRSSLQPYLVHPLWFVRLSMYPFSRVGKTIVNLIVGKNSIQENGDDEIILLAEKSAKDGLLTSSESAMISNALSLDNVIVRDIMTPRTVVAAYPIDQTLGELFAKSYNIPFARLPVYEDGIDDIKGMVRRRDLLQAMAEDKSDTTVGTYLQETIFIPENASATDALQTFLSTHQQLAVVVDEFGSVSGVLSMEDVIEHILGQEIYEKDDVAIDMRELARKKKQSHSNTAASHAEFHSFAGT